MIRSAFPSPAGHRPPELSGVCDRICPLTVAGPRGLSTHFPHLTRRELSSGEYSTLEFTKVLPIQIDGRSLP